MDDLSSLIMEEFGTSEDMAPCPIHMAIDATICFVFRRANVTKALRHQTDRPDNRPDDGRRTPAGAREPLQIRRCPSI